MGNPILDFIWFDKKRRAKNICFLLTVLMVVSALGVGYVNGLLGLISTGDEGSTPPVTQVAPQGQGPLDIDNSAGEDDDITDEEVADIISDELSDRYGHLHFGFCIDDFELTKGE